MDIARQHKSNIAGVLILLFSLFCCLVSFKFNEIN